MDRRHFIKLGIAGMTVAATGMLAGCAGGGEAPAPRSETTSQSQPSAPASSMMPATPSASATPVVAGNSLVIYYSHPEATAASDPANLTEAEENSVVVENGEIIGNTQFVAQIVAREAGAELYRIETPHEYPVDHRELVDQAQQELSSGFRPEISGGIPDQSFLAAGVLDELSVVFAPVATGDRNAATIFDAAPFAPAAPHAFTLFRAERVEGEGLHVVWRRA